MLNHGVVICLVMRVREGYSGQGGKGKEKQKGRDDKKIRWEGMMGTEVGKKVGWEKDEKVENENEKERWELKTGRELKMGKDGGEKGVKGEWWNSLSTENKNVRISLVGKIKLCIFGKCTN